MPQKHPENSDIPTVQTYCWLVDKLHWKSNPRSMFFSNVGTLKRVQSQIYVHKGGIRWGCDDESNWRSWRALRYSTIPGQTKCSPWNSTMKELLPKWFNWPTMVWPLGLTWKSPALLSLCCRTTCWLSSTWQKGQTANQPISSKSGGWVWELTNCLGWWVW